MNTKTWSPEEREEYEAICTEAWESSNRQDERTDAYLARLHDARQAHRFFASDVLGDAERRGAAAQLKSWRKAATRVAVSYDGAVILKPRVIGTQRSDDDGGWYAEQTLFDFMSWDELLEKRSEYLRQIKSYNANVAIIDRLLALRELASATANPDEAARQIGTTVEAWLTEVA